MLDPAALDTTTSYRIDALPGLWQPIWCDASEVVFRGPAGKLLVRAAELAFAGPDHLHLAGLGETP